MHSETSARPLATALRSTAVPGGSPQAETALLAPISTLPGTPGESIPLPAVFLIVDAPNGGEILHAGDTVTVRWSTTVQDGTPITSHAVRLFADANLVTEVTDLPGTAQSYALTLPNISTTRAAVSVSALNGIRVLAGDRSDNVFSIQSASAGPVITTIDPSAMRAGATTRVTAHGTNLPANAGAYAVVNSVGQAVMGVSLLPLSISTTAAVFDVMTASTVVPGPYRFVAGTASAAFEILASPAPDITSLNPSQIPPGATTLVVVNGVNLPISPLPYAVVNSAGQPINGSGIELDRGSQTPSSVRLLITLAASVTPGAYGLRVSTATGSDTAALEITGIVMPPDITAVTPSQILAGQTTQVIVDGVNLPPTASGYTVLRSDGQPVQGVGVQLTSPGARSAILQLTVPATLSAGPYQLRAQNAAGGDTFPLQILPNMVPDITALQPSQVVAGSTTRVTVSGTNLPLATSGYAVVDTTGQGVAGVGLSLVPGGGTNQVALDLTIPAFIAAGPYQLRVQNMAGFDTAPCDILASLSRVELAASPAAQSLSPGQSASSTITLVRTNFTGAVTLAVSGLPVGASASFSSNPASGNSVLLTITTLGHTVPVTRTLTISGTAPGATITATTVNLTVIGSTVGFTPPSGPVGTEVDISGPELATATGVQFGNISLPCHRIALGGAAGIPPPQIVHRLLEPSPVERAIAQDHDLRPGWTPCAHERHQGEMEVLGNMARGALAYAPGERQGTPLLDPGHHQRPTPSSHAAAIPDQHDRLHGQVTEHHLGIGETRALLPNAGVVQPPGTALDSALRLTGRRDFGGALGYLGALAAYNAAAQRRQGIQVAGEVAGGCAWIGVREGVTDGTITAQVVTHRRRLLGE